MLHIKFKGNRKCSNMVKQIFFPQPPAPSPWGKGQTIILTWLCCISNCRGSQMQQHGSKYFPSPPPPPSDLLVGSIGLNSTFSKHSHVAYQIKGIHKCSNMVANILPADPHPPWTLRTGSKGQWKLFSEHFPQPLTPDFGVGSIGLNSIFSKHENVV